MHSKFELTRGVAFGGSGLVRWGLLYFSVFCYLYVTLVPFIYSVIDGTVVIWPRIQCKGKYLKHNFLEVII